MHQYNLVVCGGTFDHFHKGHKEFLKFVLSRGKKALIGLTSDEFAHKKELDYLIDPYNTRKAAVENFLQEYNLLDKVEIVSIDNIFIPKQWESLPVEAIIVSDQSKQGAESINEDREKRKLEKLPVVIFPILKADDGGSISSYRIRKGEINRDGKPYAQAVWFEQPIALPVHLRPHLAQPFGFLITDFNKWVLSADKPAKELTITVGDAVTKSFNDHNLGQAISVVDFHIQRKRSFTHVTELGFSGEEGEFEAVNPPGMLTPELFSAVKRSLESENRNKRLIVVVEGEEDLAVLPFLLLAPLGFVIFYGQPSQGVVRVDVTEETKKRAYSLVKDFTPATS